MTQGPGLVQKGGARLVLGYWPGWKRPRVAGDGGHCRCVAFAPWWPFSDGAQLPSLPHWFSPLTPCSPPGCERRASEMCLFHLRAQGTVSAGGAQGGSHRIHHKCNPGPTPSGPPHPCVQSQLFLLIIWDRFLLQPEHRGQG